MKIRMLIDCLPKWVIQKCTLNDKEVVYDLLIRGFFKYEPLTCSCDLSEHSTVDKCFGIKMLRQGHSYKAVTPSGKLVGVVINVNFADVPEHDDSHSTGRIKQVGEFFKYVEKEMQLDESGLLELFLLAVDPDYRQQGMAKALGRKALEHANNNGYRGVKISCTSKYSADMALSLGFQLKYAIAYADYKDSDVPEWVIEKCSLDDKEAVYDLLSRAFFKYEPLTCDLKEHPPMDELFAIKMLGQGHSYKAVVPSGKIVGVVINVHFAEVPDDDDTPLTGRIKQVVKFFKFVEQESKLDDSGLLELFVVAVDPDYRQQGMAKALGCNSLEYAKANGYRGVKISCTSKYSADMALSLGFQLMYAVAYTDYKDSDGKPIFSPGPPEPHTHARILVKEFGPGS